MVDSQHRRHSRWYEVLLFSFWFQLVLGIIFSVVLPMVINWPSLLILSNLSYLEPVQVHTMLANSCAFILVFLLYKNIQKLPSAQSIIYLLSVITLSWLIVVGIVLFLRAGYSRPTIFISFCFANVFMVAGYYFGRKYQSLKLAVIPYGNYHDFYHFDKINIKVLERPSLENKRYDAVVADLRADMPDEWQQFLANCALANIPVYHSRLMIEQLTGRVKVTHLSENIFGVLYTTSFYGVIKRLIEIALVLVLLPFWLPLMLMFGIAIKLENAGPMFFIQERVGLGDKNFKLYKLRSMYCNAEKAGAKFAQEMDDRVTRVGKFIRKTRIDEIPQFMNIIKGDMSLIGPRPEQRIFVEQFKKEIPFYSYRHVVRPGISGWAQVSQGYAADVDETSVKLEFDLYYIKHFSFWLDVLIVFKTIRTMLTGFGAR